MHLLLVQDLLQYAEREKWYTARFCADDAPDWNPATFVRSRQITPKLREVRYCIPTMPLVLAVDLVLGDIYKARDIYLSVYIQAAP